MERGGGLSHWPDWCYDEVCGDEPARRLVGPNGVKFTGAGRVKTPAGRNDGNAAGTDGPINGEIRSIEIARRGAIRPVPCRTTVGPDPE